MSKLSEAVKEYKISDEYHMLTKRYSQIMAYHFTANQHRNCLSSEARAAYIKAESIASKFEVSVEELLKNV